MSAITTYVYDGVQGYAQYEYTSSQVASRYAEDMSVLANLLTLQTSGSTTPASQLTQEDVDQVNAAIADLQSLAVNGMTIPNAADPGTTTTSYMNVQMANNADLLLRSLSAVGITSNNATLSTLQLWLDTAQQTSSISTIFQSAAVAVSQATRTLQSLVETSYIATANQVITDTLNSLENQLTLTNQVVGTLTDVQDMHNNITISAKGSFSSLFNFLTSLGSNQSAYASQYGKVASSFFGVPITPTVASGLNYTFAVIHVGPLASIKTVIDPGTNFKSAMLELIQLRTSLSSEIAQLSAVTGASSLTNPDSLYGRLKSVYDDITSNFTISNNYSFLLASGQKAGQPVTASTNVALAYSGFIHYLLDNYSSFTSTTASQAGAYQQNITNAIAAAQSLNTTQQQKVRQYMFVFQEYYQSASAILQALETTLTQMAQNIAH